MTYSHDDHHVPRVAEPVQVYLQPSDQDRLGRLTAELGTSKSDVLRRGLDALERQLTDPRDHPALRVIGLGASDPKASEPDYDTGREHDRFLADSEVAAWRDSSASDDD